MVAYIQRTSGTVVFRGAALLILGLLEVMQNFRKPPARISGVTPVVVIFGIASNVDHGVNRTAAAQDLAPGPIDLAVFQLWLVLSKITPCHSPFGISCKEKDPANFRF